MLIKELISHIPKDFTVAVEDESIFTHHALIKRMWTPKGKRPIELAVHTRKLVYLEHYAPMDDNSSVNTLVTYSIGRTKQDRHHHVLYSSMS